MTNPWTFAGEPQVEIMAANPVTLVEGSTFCISEPTGNIAPDRAQGLFVRDTRVLCWWELTVNAAIAQPLSVEHPDPYAAAFVGRVKPPSGIVDSTLLVVRRRYIGDGMREDVTIRNLDSNPVTCVVELHFAADFADLFEVKDGRVHPAGPVHTEAQGDCVRMALHRGSHLLAVQVKADGAPQAGAGFLRWNLTLPGRGQWTTTLEVIPEIDGVALSVRHPRDSVLELAIPARRLQEWRQRSPEIETADATFASILDRSSEDIGSLRIFDPQHPERAVVAAGAPWFMAVFGRDSLLTSWMVLPVDASLAIGTLRTLADHQGRRVDPATEEEPGRILHEVRFGPATDFTLGGRTVYYGTADATPLFVMLLGELSRWGGDAEAIETLLPHADRALNWIEEYGDLDGDGFIEYRRKTEEGLVNQGWKDSWDGISYADGRLPEAPVALAEVQAYCYAAFRARAHLAANSGDNMLSAHWTDKAVRLKRRFNEEFWIPDRGWFAVALDGKKRQVDALTSNIGHCLWTGIVDDDKAASVADHLLSPDLFSGWGIRTLAESAARYNPMSYHNGSIWPHDNAICASGLMRYGFVEHAQRVIAGLLDAAEHFDHRLPELFCGFSRADFGRPVPYPAACSPQAWAAASPFSFLRTLLRFDPELPSRQVVCSPQLPARYLPLRVDGLRVATLEISVDVQVGGWKVEGLEGTGIELASPSGTPNSGP